MAESTGKLQRLAGLSAWQWYVLLATSFVLMINGWRLRRSGYQRTLARIQTENQTTLGESEALDLARDTAFAVAVAVKYGPWRPRCLLRSLTLAWFLARKGLPFELKIGVSEETPLSDPGWEAHAWVEHAGVVLNDREDVGGEYRVF